MIVLRLKADNLSCFKDFDINFVYKKKNNSSTIKNEYLSFCKSFNYKKINIIYGNNASGKTSLGLLLCDIFNFIFKKYTDGLFELVNDEKRQSYFMLDFICDKKTVNRVECIIDANKKIKMRFCFVSIKRNYEYLEPILDYYIESKSYSDDLRELDYFNNFGGWRFLFPSTDMNKIFCDFGENNNYKIEYASDEEFQEYLDLCLESSLYDFGVEVNTDSQIVSLSTCTSVTENERFLVHGVLTSVD